VIVRTGRCEGAGVGWQVSQQSSSLSGINKFTTPRSIMYCAPTIQQSAQVSQRLYSYTGMGKRVIKESWVMGDTSIGVYVPERHGLRLESCDCAKHDDSVSLRYNANEEATGILLGTVNGSTRRG